MTALKHILREPLLHFFIVGAVLFAFARAHSADTAHYRIVVDPASTHRLALNYQQQYGSAPDAAQLDFLRERYIHQEILYREGLALGLDRDDEIIRRRIVQKYEFLQQDLSVVAAPSEEQLQAFYDLNKTKYTVSEKISFSHIYFSADEGGDQRARQRAERVLEKLRAEDTRRAPERGDRFPDLYDYAALGPVEVQRLFGESDFAVAVFKSPVNQWVGPFKSGFGWHLIYISDKTAAHVPPLSEVHDQVQFDYLAQAREQKNNVEFTKLAKKYTVVQAAEGRANVK